MFFSLLAHFSNKNHCFASVFKNIQVLHLSLLLLMMSLARKQIIHKETFEFSVSFSNFIQTLSVFFALLCLPYIPLRMKMNCI